MSLPGHFNFLECILSSLLLSPFLISVFTTNSFNPSHTYTLLFLVFKLHQWTFYQESVILSSTSILFQSRLLFICSLKDHDHLWRQYCHLDLHDFFQYHTHWRSIWNAIYQHEFLLWGLYKTCEILSSLYFTVGG